MLSATNLNAIFSLTRYRSETTTTMEVMQCDGNGNARISTNVQVRVRT